MDLQQFNTLSKARMHFHHAEKEQCNIAENEATGAILSATLLGELHANPAIGYDWCC